MTRRVINLETESYFWKHVILLPTASNFYRLHSEFTDNCQIIRGGTYPHAPRSLRPWRLGDSRAGYSQTWRCIWLFCCTGGICDLNTLFMAAAAGAVVGFVVGGVTGRYVGTF